MLKEKLGVTLEELNTECGFFSLGRRVPGSQSKNALHKNSSGRLAEGVFLDTCSILCIQNIASNLRNFREGRSGNCV